MAEVLSLRWGRWPDPITDLRTGLESRWHQTGSGSSPSAYRYCQWSYHHGQCQDTLLRSHGKYPGTDRQTSLRYSPCGRRLPSCGHGLWHTQTHHGWSGCWLFWWWSWLREPYRHQFSPLLLHRDPRYSPGRSPCPHREMEFRLRYLILPDGYWHKDHIFYEGLHSGNGTHVQSVSW